MDKHFYLNTAFLTKNLDFLQSKFTSKYNPFKPHFLESIERKRVVCGEKCGGMQGNGWEIFTDQSHKTKILNDKAISFHGLKYGKGFYRPRQILFPDKTVGGKIYFFIPFMAELHHSKDIFQA